MNRRFEDFTAMERCAAVGACLEPSEKKKLLRKAGHRTRGLPEIDIHRTIVTLSGEDKSLAGKISSLLEHRYSRLGSEWFSKPETERIPLWRAGLSQSDFAHMLWTGLVRGNQDFREAIVKDFRAHQIQSVRKASERLRTIDRLLGEKERLEEKYGNARARERQAKREAVNSSSALKKALAEIRRSKENSQFEGRSNTEKDLAEENAVLTEKLSSLENRLAWREDALAKKELQLEKLEKENNELQESNKAALDEIESLLSKLREKESDCLECPRQQSCSRNVLLVGGITKLEAVYRSVVEKTGGDFRYHTGRYVGGEEMLRDRISWADVVLCPVDVNSHRAALGVKKICRKLDKPFVMLRTSSVSGVARALEELPAQPGV